MADSGGPWTKDPLYYEALQSSQVGDWEKAERAYSTLLERYTGDAEVRAQIEQRLEEARLRRSLDESAGKKVAKARRPVQRGRVVMWSLVTVVVLAGIFAVATAQPAPAAPVPTVDAAATETALRGGLLQQARTAIAGGRYGEAIAILQDVLSRFPFDEEVKALLQWANDRWQLAVMYDRAVGLMDQGDWANAVVVFQDILSRDANYRDASALLERASQEMSLGGVWEAAEAEYAAGNWEVAAKQFGEIRRAYPDYRRSEVGERLYHSYMSLGLGAVEGARGMPQPVAEAVEWFNLALKLRPGDPRATEERRLAQTFLPAYQAFNDEERLDEAIGYLQALYDARFSYMKGVVAQMLYDAYTTRAARYEAAGDLGKAVADYAAAERITGPATSYASQRRLALTLSLTPTPTPTSPPTPTPFQWSSSLLPATPTPEPTPQPLATYKGQIAFWTDREGVTQIFLMNPDGSDQRPANLARWGATEFEDLRKQEMIAPDGRWQVYVAAGNNRIAQVWISELVDGVATGRNKQLTSLDAVSYDPVWSPDNVNIAFVSEQTGSDDIWIIRADGTQPPRQLTENDWEWEKHPSWSPDGQYIVYWSNLGTGRQQIWIMNPDGSNQRNLSNNDYNDWDPIWIK